MEVEQENPFTDNNQQTQQNYSTETTFTPNPLFKVPVPYGIATFVLGICSLVLDSVCVGFVCGIVGLVLGNKGLRSYQECPAKYRGYGYLNAGRIMSIIGIILGALMIVFWILLGSACIAALACEW